MPIGRARKQCETSRTRTFAEPSAVDGTPENGDPILGEDRTFRVVTRDGNHKTMLSDTSCSSRWWSVRQAVEFPTNQFLFRIGWSEIPRSLQSLARVVDVAHLASKVRTSRVPEVIVPFE